jgi:hypothetical protein
MKCPNCGHPVPRGIDRCPDCGQVIAGVRPAWISCLTIPLILVAVLTGVVGTCTVIQTGPHPHDEYGPVALFFGVLAFGICGIATTILVIIYVISKRKKR